MIDEFCAPHPEQNGEQSDDFQIFYINGLLAVVFSFGVLFTSVKSVTARSWQYGTGTLNCSYFILFNSLKTQIHARPPYMLVSVKHP